MSDDSIAEQQRTLDVLRDWALAHDEWPSEEVFDRVARATYAQATKTFSAITALTGLGYGEDAGRLGRSLYESLVVAYWMAYVAEPAWVIDRMREHREYASLVWVETMERHQDWEQPDYEADRRARLEAGRDRLKKLYGSHAEVSWWARDVIEHNGGWKVSEQRNLSDLAAAVLEVPDLEGRLWEPAGDGEHRPTPLLETLYDIPQRFNNQLIHHNPSGLAGYVDLVEDDLAFTNGPSEHWVSQAQLVAYICFSLHTQLMIDKYNPDLLGDYEAAVDPIFLKTWVTLNDDALRFAKDGANRNKPCPCGSRFKCKQCHGL